MGPCSPARSKAAALGLGLTVTDRLEDVLAAGAELGVVVAYGRIIPEAVLDQLPMVNLHFSLLPRWRGAAPVERAILEGDAETGVCLMAVEAGLDTGPIYARADTVIGDDETAEELRSRLVPGVPAVGGEPGPRCGRTARARDQAGVPTYAEKILPGDLRIDWEQTAIEIHRVVRVGRAWTTWRDHRLGVLATAAAAGRPRCPGRVPGTLEGTTVVAGRGNKHRAGFGAAGGQAPDGRDGLAPRRRAAGGAIGP